MSLDWTSRCIFQYTHKKGIESSVLILIFFSVYIHMKGVYKQWVRARMWFNPLSVNSTKWSTTFKQLVGPCRRIVWACLANVGAGAQRLNVKSIVMQINRTHFNFLSRIFPEVTSYCGPLILEIVLLCVKFFSKYSSNPHL